MIIWLIILTSAHCLYSDTNVSGWGTVKIEKTRAELLVTRMKINMLLSFEETHLPLQCALHITSIPALLQLHYKPKIIFIQRWFCSPFLMSQVSALVVSAWYQPIAAQLPSSCWSTVETHQYSPFLDTFETESPRTITGSMCQVRLLRQIYRP